MNSARVINRLFGTATVVTVACLVGTVSFNVAETVDYRVRAAELAVITLPKEQRLTLHSMRLAPQLDVAAISRETPLLLIGTAAECALCDAAAVTYEAVIARLSRSGTAVRVMALDASPATRPLFEMPGIPSRRLRDPLAFSHATGVRGVPFAFAVDRIGGVALHIIGAPLPDDIVTLASALGRGPTGDPTRMIVRDYVPMYGITRGAGAQ